MATDGQVELPAGCMLLPVMILLFTQCFRCVSCLQMSKPIPKWGCSPTGRCIRAFLASCPMFQWCEMRNIALLNANSVPQIMLPSIHAAMTFTGIRSRRLTAYLVLYHIGAPNNVFLLPWIVYRPFIPNSSIYIIIFHTSSPLIFLVAKFALNAQSPVFCKSNGLPYTTCHDENVTMHLVDFIYYTVCCQGVDYTICIL